MSFWDTAEQPDYEEPDTTISYTLDFADGGDKAYLTITRPTAEEEIEAELSDPTLIAALHVACQKVVDDYFQALLEREELELVRESQVRLGLGRGFYSFDFEDLPL